MKSKDFFKIFKNRKYLSPLIVVMVFIFALLLDQLTKTFIIANLIPNVGDYMSVIPKVISFIFVKNKGAAWGIFEDNTIFLIIMTFIGMAIIMTFYILRLKNAGNKSSILLAVTVGLIMGGAIGNLGDRLFLGYVRDFINFDFMNFPVFNFADIALTFGIILLVIYIIFFYSKETDSKNTDKNQNVENKGISIQDKQNEKEIEEIKIDDKQSSDLNCDNKEGDDEYE